MGTSVVIEKAFRDCVGGKTNPPRLKCLYLWRNDEADANRILRAVEAERWGDLAEVEGFFAGAYYVGDKVYLFCDQLGIYPLFYLSDKGMIYVSPVIRSLQDAAVVGSSPSPEGMVSLLLFGHHLADETLFEGIRRCPGGQTVVVDLNGRIEKGIVWKKQHVYQSQGSTSPAELCDLFVENVRMQVPSATDVLLALSGGFDSRAVLGAALECVGADAIHAMTFGGADTSDLKIGRLVAEHAGVQSTVFPIDGDFFDAAFLRQRAADYSYTYSSFATQPAEMLRFLAADDSRSKLSLWGVGGDAISGSHLHDDDIDLPRCGDFAARARLLLKDRLCIPVGIVSQIVGIGSSDIEAIIARLLERVGLNEYDESWQFLDAWDIFVRGRMEIIGVLPFGVASWRCPHLRGEYFRKMSTQCFGQKLHQAAYKEMLAGRFENLFSLPSKRLRGKSLVSTKRSAKSEFDLRAARAGNRLLRAINLETDSSDRNYGKDQGFFRGTNGRERLLCSATILVEQKVVSCSVEKTVSFGQSDVQLARMLITIAYAFETDAKVR